MSDAADPWLTWLFSDQEQAMLRDLWRAAARMCRRCGKSNALSGEPFCAACKVKAFHE